jgi:argininosuccinate synthase
MVGRTSPISLYDTALATYDAPFPFDQTWSKGFIEIWTMPTVVTNARKRQRARPIRKFVKVNSQS